MSAPPNCCGTTPSLTSTAPPQPPMRNLMPFRSSTVLISRFHQPPAWVPVLPHGHGTNEGEGGVLADIVIAGAVPHFDRAILHRVQDLERRHDLAAGEDAD